MEIANQWSAALTAASCNPIPATLPSGPLIEYHPISIITTVKGSPERKLECAERTARKADRTKCQVEAAASLQKRPWHWSDPLVVTKFHVIMVTMTGKLTVDKLGRIVLPKPVREKLQLAAGDQLEMESLDDRITLRPLRGTAQLRKKRGVWVFHSGEPLAASTVQETIEQIRRERDEHNLGKSR